jgi:hypothetical protein
MNTFRRQFFRLKRTVRKYPCGWSPEWLLLIRRFHNGSDIFGYLRLWVQKKTSNHWILATYTPGNLRFVPWDTNLALRDDVIVLYGEGCASALLSRSLGEWKQPAFSGGPRELVFPAA